MANGLLGKVRWPAKEIELKITSKPGEDTSMVVEVPLPASDNRKETDHAR